MSVTSAARKPLGVRATPAQHKVLVEAAARANRSVSGFVLTAALNAAMDADQPRKSSEEVHTILQAARDEICKHNPENRDLVAELIAERRAAASGE